MRRSISSFVIIAATTAATASLASSLPNSATDDAFGEAAQSVSLQDVHQNAEKLFARVDTDRNGEISIDEYAAQSVVIASLTRFRSRVVLDSEETIYIPLHGMPAEGLSGIEQTAIDAVARNKFYKISTNGAPLDKNAWIAAKLSEFAEVDFDQNGHLENRELDAYTLSIAQYRVTSSAV